MTQKISTPHTTAATMPSATTSQQAATDPQRYNIFNLIHKALRAMLYEASVAIQQTDFNDTKEAEPTIIRIEKVLYYFDEHALHEDKFILPAIERYNQPLVEEMESEHVVDLALAKSLREAIAAWKATEDEAVMLKLGKSISNDFQAFIAFNLTHMNKEEKLLTAVLWEYFSDLEIMQIEQTLIASIEPEVLLDESRWMMRSINNQEVIAWLSGIRNNAPKEVFNLFWMLAEEELPKRRLAQVRAALTDGLMLAV